MLRVLEPYRQVFPETDLDALCALDGVEYKRIQNRRTFRVERAGQGYFIKCHRGVGWREIVKNLAAFKRPVLGAVNEWRAIHRLHELGIETMAPVAVGRRGWNPATQDSLLITAELASCISLEDYLRPWAGGRPPLRQRRILIRRLAQIARRLHSNGVNHRDFYLCHLLIRQPWDGSDADLHLYLIDLHRVQLRARTPRRWVVKDVGSLWFSARELDLRLTRADLLTFVRHYRDVPLRAGLDDDAGLWRAVGRRCAALYASRPALRAGDRQ
ncbi:MAG: lipopolysaccharide core heptose(I) kinase RfaP [Gammaproteobacteria bacterium]|nr:lipopolysaccharide core heptose(I) kinase RfaP [Gammaproteobacteria bacterium]